MYLEYDLTASNEDYRVDNDLYYLFKELQRIQFDVPIYYDTLAVYLVNDVSKPLSGDNISALVRDVDYRYEPSDKAYTDEAKIRVAAKQFDKVLVTGITILRPYVGNVIINCQYQQLFPVSLKPSLLKGEVLNVTPGLIGDMLEKINYLYMVASGIQDTHSKENGSPLLLEKDIHKNIPANYIRNEKHTVNVLEGKNIIYPLGGSFFNNSEKLHLDGITEPLEKGKDYIVFGEDLHKTRISPVTDGVYNFILLKKEVAGNVYVSYHAFGGTPTLYDMKELTKKVNGMRALLHDSTFVTKESIGYVPLVKEIIDRMVKLEENMRILLQGRPTYGDAHSRAIVKRVKSNDEEIHWTTIASLYKVDGSDDVVVTDRMHIRVQTLKSKLMFDAMISFNMVAERETEIFNINVLSENVSNGSKSVADYVDMNKLIRPMFRVIWNEDVNKSSGVLLQIGFNYNDIVSETIVVEDNSGAESCWKLVDVEDKVYTPEDNVVQLPNSSHIWDISNVSVSKCQTQLVPFKNGYLVWKGSYSTNVPTGGTKVEEFLHYLPAGCNLIDFVKFRFEFKEQDYRSFFIDVPVSYNGSDGVYGVGSFSYGEMPAHVAIRVFYDINSDSVKMNVTTMVDNAQSSTAQLDIKHIWVYA